MFSQKSSIIHVLQGTKYASDFDSFFLKHRLAYMTKVFLSITEPGDLCIR